MYRFSNEHKLTFFEGGGASKKSFEKMKKLFLKV